jgi:hypothetical protein
MKSQLQRKNALGGGARYNFFTIKDSIEKIKRGCLTKRQPQTHTKITAAGTVQVSAAGLYYWCETKE